jgi:hypothetical protein
MRIQRSHDLGRAAAIKKIDTFLNGLMARPLPAGVKVKDAQKKWDGGRMAFSCRFSKGIMGASVRGTVDVSEKDVVLNCALPSLITTFVGVDKIKRVIHEQVDELFKR